MKNLIFDNLPKKYIYNKFYLILKYILVEQIYIKY